MEILTEFDELQAALAKVNMNESVFTYQNGKLINSDAYNKTQKILNCPEMISAHKYLYDLDMDQLTEDDENKINQLYDLGVKRGFIIDDLTKWDDEDNGEEAEEDVEVAVEQPIKPQNTLFKAKIPCWTIIYSATKDGDIKTGEAYSNAVSMSAAKADVNAKLSQCGYDNITILAIENCTDAPKSEISVQPALSEADNEDDSSSDDSNDDTSNDDTSDDSNGNDDSEDDSTEDDSNDDTSDDSNGNDDSEDDSTEDDSDDSSNEDGEEDDSAADDEGSTEDGEAGNDATDDGEEDEDSESKDSEEDSGEEDEDSDSSDEEGDDEEKSDDGEELDANEKAELRDLYRKIFKNTLVKCKFDTSFNDLTLEQKVKFFTELNKAWKKDNDPKDFMTDKEIEQLNNVVAQKTSSSDDDSSDDSED